MPEEIKEQVLKPKYTLTRAELASLIEHATGRKPKSGFTGLSVAQLVDGTGRIMWVDAETPEAEKTPAKLTPTKPTKGQDAGKSNNS